MTDTPEFSRLLSVARIPPSGTQEKLSATPTECAALAKRFDLVSVGSLSAELDIAQTGRQSFKVTGTIKGEVAQRCVVTLESLPVHINLNVDMTFIPAVDDVEATGNTYPDELEEEFEVYSGSKIDLGEMVAQYMAISLDPYPRKPDAALPKTEFGAKIEVKQPFAKLAEAFKKQKE